LSRLTAARSGRLELPTF